MSRSLEYSRVQGLVERKCNSDRAAAAARRRAEGESEAERRARFDTKLVWDSSGKLEIKKAVADLNNETSRYNIHINTIDRSDNVPPQFVAILILNLYINSADTGNSVTFFVDASKNVSIVQRLSRSVRTKEIRIEVICLETTKELLIDFLDAAIDRPNAVRAPVAQRALRRRVGVLVVA